MLLLRVLLGPVQPRAQERVVRSRRHQRGVLARLQRDLGLREFLDDGAPLLHDGRHQRPAVRLLQRASSSSSSVVRRRRCCCCCCCWRRHLTTLDDRVRDRGRSRRRSSRSSSSSVRRLIQVVDLHVVERNRDVVLAKSNELLGIQPLDASPLDAGQRDASRIEQRRLAQKHAVRHAAQCLHAVDEHRVLGLRRMRQHGRADLPVLARDASLPRQLVRDQHERLLLRASGGGAGGVLQVDPLRKLPQLHAKRVRWRAGRAMAQLAHERVVVAVEEQVLAREVHDGHVLGHRLG